MRIGKHHGRMLICLHVCFPLSYPFMFVRGVIDKKLGNIGSDFAAISEISIIST